MYNIGLFMYVDCLGLDNTASSSISTITNLVNDSSLMATGNPGGIIDGYFSLNGNSFITANNITNTQMNINFIFETIVKYVSADSPVYLFTANAINSTSPVRGLIIDTTGLIYILYGLNTDDPYALALNTNINIKDSLFHHIEFQSISGSPFNLFLDGKLVYNSPQNSEIYFNVNLPLSFDLVLGGAGNQQSFGYRNVLLNFIRVYTSSATYNGLCLYNFCELSPLNNKSYINENNNFYKIEY